MTSNFTAAELRGLAGNLELESSICPDAQPFTKEIAALREYAALKEAAEKGVTDEVVMRCMAGWLAAGFPSVNVSHEHIKAGLLAVAPLLALKGDKP